ncbi:cytoskeleton-associated protein 5 [Paragonimus westermani]|uniref:Cytoskeleton-associated protein 5 n=1 Tax=Paragonimus westermani TaxID=34504 RepID=A0A5J4NT36_9TREM|nr:cytoskeleton-associated protein 5 [Paragonimus westermani]
MTDNDEWTSLPTIEKVQHSRWNARVQGYTEALNLFTTQDSEDSPVFNEYVGLIKKFVLDSNAIAQEAALSSVLAFLENANVATRCAPDVCCALVTKGLGATRAKTKDKAIECLLQMVEIERHEVACEELLKGLSNKNPKLVVGCLQTLREILNLFGPKVVPLKPLTKEFPRLFDDRDENVRNETKNLVVEFYRWFGQSNKSLLTGLKPVVVNDITALLEQLPTEKPVPQRFLKGQQPKQTTSTGPSQGSAGGITSVAMVTDDPVSLDDLIPAVEVLASIPKDYWTLITEKKWQDRQSALESIDNLTNVPNIAPGDFGELIKSLLHVLNKDTNVVLTTLAAKILGQLANGLKKKYAPYAPQTVSACLAKLKERKASFIAVLRNTLDAAVKSIPLDTVADDLVNSLAHKTPGVRAEVALFLSRFFGRSSPATLNKKLLKTFTVALCETSKDTAGDVRENSFAALGALMRLVGPKQIEPFLADLDAIRLGKIKEYSEKAVDGSTAVGGTNASGAESRPGTAPSATGSKPRRGAPPVQRPATAATKETSESGEATITATTKSSASGPPKRKPTVTKSSKPNVITETLLSDEQVTQQAHELLGEDLVNMLSSSDLKQRLEGVTKIQERSQSVGLATLPAQVLCRVITQKPGLKDTNLQVLRARLELLQQTIEANKSMSSTMVEVLVPDLMEKIGDAKVGEAVKSVLTALSERAGFAVVGTLLLKSVFESKNPRNQAESLQWLAQSVREFGMKLPPQEVPPVLRTGLNATNPAVRQASLSLAGSVHLYLGDPLRSLLADEKPAVVTLLNAEFDKNAGQKPPVPTRGRLEKTGSEGQTVADDGAGDVDTVTEELDSEALFERVDIRPQITTELMSLLSNKNWKDRQQALSTIQNILNAAKHIEGSNGALQELLSAIAKACGDANKNLSKFALVLLDEFAKALPKSDAAKYVRFVEPAILLCLGDSKPQVREAAYSALSAWQSRVPFVAMLENDMLSDALKVENANLRADLLRWLTGALTCVPANSRKQLPPDLTENLMPHVFAAMEDRNPDARKQAQLALPQLIRVLGWDGVSKAANRLKSTSKDTVMPHLEKAREAVATELHPGDDSTKVAAKPKVVRGGGHKGPSTASSAPADDTDDIDSSPTSASTAAGRPGKKKPDAKKTGNAATTTSKKPIPNDQAAVAAPLQANRAAKSARLTDEKKRKLLKWEFDAPTRDHVQQLNQLFLASGASPELHASLFHSDFKQHVKGLDQLSQFLDTPEGEEATAVNVDLILRWIVLRFFETNPVVVGRCLDYTTKLFSRLSEAGLNLTEHEAGAFLPYLILKAGDSKDAVRQSVRGLFRLVVNLYPPSRLFVFLSNGVKSKINKTRQECLDEMGSLIERFGVNVCQPSVPVALKAICQQIGDRDSGVRSAALNALVSAYAIVGEQLWKIIGSLPDKDRTMLEERIKRAGRPPTASSMDTSESRVPPISSVRTKREPSEGRQPMDSVRMAPKWAEPVSIAQQRARAMLSELGDLSPEKAPNMPDLIQLDADISDLFKPIEVPALKTQARQPVLNALLRTSPDTASAITMVVTAISSNDLLVSCHALAELDMVLRDEKWYLLLNHVNQILMLITMQLKQVTARYFGDSSISDDQLATLVRCHLATVESLFKRPTLGREASRETLRELIQSLLQVMLDERTTRMPDGENVIRAINALCVNIIEAANGTRVLSALLRLLHESVSNGHFTHRFTQSIMKSIWRITKGMDSTVNNYAFDVILLDCHDFLKAFPSASWKTRKSDVPLRTVKTLLHVMCRYQGSSILNFLESIPNSEDSELEAYLNRTLKTLGTTSSITTHQRKPSGSDARTKPMLPSAATRERLTEIFKKVGSKQPEQGLEELYDFTQMYPEVDLSVFLTKTSQFFQTYIRQALKNIAVERARQTKSGSAAGDTDRSHMPPSGTPNGMQPGLVDTVRMDILNEDPHSVDPKVFMNRLAQLRRELGLGGVSTTQVDESPGLLGVTNLDGCETGSPSHPALENTLRNMMNPGEPGSTDQTDQSEATQPDSRPTLSAQELLDIKRRLDRIKSGQPV